MFLSILEVKDKPLVWILGLDSASPLCSSEVPRFPSPSYLHSGPMRLFNVFRVQGLLPFILLPRCTLIPLSQKWSPGPSTFPPDSLLTRAAHHPAASELKPRELPSPPKPSSKLLSETLWQLEFWCEYVLCKSELCDFKRAQAKNINEISLYAQTLKECKSSKLKKKSLRTSQFELHFQWLICWYISALALGEPQ